MKKRIENEREEERRKPISLLGPSSEKDLSGGTIWQLCLIVAVRVNIL
jgi:hypothetical protein